MAKEGLVLVVLSDGNRGTHGIVGPQSKRSYGYRRDGEQFYVLPDDVDVMERVGVVRKVEAEKKEAEKPVEKPDNTLSAPSADDTALLALGGVDEERLAKLKGAGFSTVAKLAEADSKALLDLLDTAPGVITRIQNAAKRSLEE